MPDSPLDVRQRRALREVVTSPSKFARSVLGHSLWPTQEAILEAVATHSRVAVKACHSSGKTFTAAEAGLWWITRWPDGVVVNTAPTWVQVEKLLWGEIHKAVEKSKVEYPSPNKTELKLGPGRYMMGLSTNEGVRFQGFHGRLLIIIDEAPGVKPDIWEAIEGIRAGGDVHILALGNPVVSGGVFYDAFGSNRANWKTFTIDAFDTPNLYSPDLERQLTEDELLALPESDLDYAPRPYLTTRRWVREKLLEWGPDSPIYQSRVRGQFPRQSQDSLISIGDLERAAAKLPADDGGKVCVGVDVAGPGEAETVLKLRCGDTVLKTLAWALSDPRGEVVTVLTPYVDRLEEVNVDSNGIGYNFALFLQDWVKEKRPDSWKDVVHFVNVGEKSSDPEKFRNLKAELWWRLKDRYATGRVAAETDETTMSQLSVIRYRINSRGQIEIETKDELRKRGVPSPDRAEAEMLCFADLNLVDSQRYPTEHPISLDKLSEWNTFDQMSSIL